MLENRKWFCREVSRALSPSGRRRCRGDEDGCVGPCATLRADGEPPKGVEARASFMVRLVFEKMPLVAGQVWGGRETVASLGLFLGERWHDLSQGRDSGDGGLGKRLE